MLLDPQNGDRKTLGLLVRQVSAYRKGNSGTPPAGVGRVLNSGSDYSVVVISWAQVLGSGEHTDQTGWIVNQPGHVLGTDPDRGLLVGKLDQGRRIGVSLTRQAAFVGLFVGHSLLHSFKVSDPGHPESRCWFNGLL